MPGGLLQPELLVLDEPTSNVDSVVEARLLEVFRELNRRMTILMVSHDLGFVSGLVESVICVNRRVTAHPTSRLTGEIMTAVLPPTSGGSSATTSRSPTTMGPTSAAMRTAIPILTNCNSIGMSDFREILVFLSYPILVGLLASVSLGIIGSYVVTRRITYIAAAISHCVFGGIGVAYYLQIAQRAFLV